MRESALHPRLLIGVLTGSEGESRHPLSGDTLQLILGDPNEFPGHRRFEVIKPTPASSGSFPGFLCREAPLSGCGTTLTEAV